MVHEAYWHGGGVSWQERLALSTACARCHAYWHGGEVSWQEQLAPPVHICGLRAHVGPLIILQDVGGVHLSLAASTVMRANATWRRGRSRCPRVRQGVAPWIAVPARRERAGPAFGGIRPGLTHRFWSLSGVAPWIEA